jgi:cytidine deaminase
VAEISFEDAGAAVLVEAAIGAARHAYAPYSRFAVGAALLMEDGAIVTGANVENASYGLSLCAETVAVATASAQGRLGQVIAVAVTGGRLGKAGLTGEAVVRPCGRCRQILNEAAQVGGRDIAVYCASADGATVERHSLSALLPHAFGPDDLG